MGAQIVYPPELREIDRFFNELANKSDFVNLVQSPAYKDKLHVAVSHLAAEWPTAEEIAELEGTIKALGNGFSKADGDILDNLKTVRDFKYLDDYDSSASTSAQDAILFEKLNARRPEGRHFFDRYRGVGNGSVVNSIFSIGKMY